MRIAVLGANGKIGQELCRLIGEAEDLTLAERIGSGEAEGGQVPLSSAALDADLVIDFSAPAATMQLLDRLGSRPTPIVVGTTAFDAGQAARLVAQGPARPILIGANFAPGFTQFRAAGLALAAALPEARITLSETYHALKKPVASGTTAGLLADLRALAPASVPEIEILRTGTTPGINEFRFDLGTSHMDLRFSVASRAAYAVGALAAARWLATRPRGYWQPSDMLADEDFVS